MRRLTILLVALAGLLVPAPAGAAIYWGHDGWVGVANLDGSSAQPYLNERFDSGRTCGLAVDSSHLYWSDFSLHGSIGRANLDGSAPDEAFISGLGAPCGVAVDGSHIYWTDKETGLIGRAKLDGSEVERGFISGGAGPSGVAVDGSHIYWSNFAADTIGRAKLDGSEVEQDYLVGPARPWGLAVTPTHLYWTAIPTEVFEAGAIGRAALGGGAVDNFFIPNVGEAFSLAADSTHLYWTDEGWRNFRFGGNPEQALPGSVGRAPLDGTEANRRLVPTGLALGVAVDGRALPGAPPRPSDYLRYGKLTRDRSTGALQLIVHVPARGEFRVDAPQIGWRIDKGNPPPWLLGTFSWKLKLWPGKGTPAAKRIRRQLRRKGKATFVLRATYQQEGRLPLEGSKRLTFLRPQR